MEIGGDHVEYEGTVPTHMAGMTTIKWQANSLISKTKARFCGKDIKTSTLELLWNIRIRPT